MINYRKLGKTGFKVSEVGLGTWQLGGKWGEQFDDRLAEEILNNAIDNGINFIDTADVYNGGLSEKAIGKVLKSRSERIYVATKCGRQLSPHVDAAYRPDVLRKFVEDSLRNLQIECLDLIQLHCPPTETYYRAEIFELFDRLKEEGKVANLGVSVEKIEEALKAIEFDNVTTVQIIFNMFRHRPSELFFREAKRRDIGVIVRVPLASGLLAGKFGKTSSFLPDDHRNFNRNGEMFDKGETFSGVDYETGLKAVEELKELFNGKTSLAQMALKWVLMFDEVSTVIPGASKPEQLRSNIGASTLPALSQEQMNGVKNIYEKYVKKEVHQRW
ncbi:MAG: aryl-alcohol dehydrogenase-like predicted oxidoreductase [Cyclobacteriaceae bacterium]|jgi:aryl-alcohol dehydrogenase-like predicted oxidoreductase